MQRSNSGFSQYNWGPNNLTIKVTSLDSDRVDIHKNISREEADWINVSPNLRVEVLEISMRRVKRNNNND